MGNEVQTEKEKKKDEGAKLTVIYPFFKSILDAS